jgi:hypothetical protein
MDLASAQLDDGAKLSLEERKVWGTCSVCGAAPGEYCDQGGSPALGQRAGGGDMQMGEGVHVQRIVKAPMHVRVVEL